MELITPRKKLALTLLILVSITLSSGLAAKSSIAKVFSSQELFASSDTVVVGKVLGIKSQLGTGEGPSIFTVVTVQVEEYQKGGTNAKEIEFMIPGGTVGDVGMWVEDCPEFQIGEKLLLYLTSSGSTPMGALPRYMLTIWTFPWDSEIAPLYFVDGIKRSDELIDEYITSSAEDIVAPIMLFTLSVSLVILWLNQRK
jgi:hypothetical protein